MRGFKSNKKKKNAFNKLLKLLGAVDFININQANRLIDWNKAPIVEL